MIPDERIVQVPDISGQRRTNHSFEFFIDISGEENLMQAAVIPSIYEGSESIDATRHVVCVFGLPIYIFAIELLNNDP